MTDFSWIQISLSKVDHNVACWRKMLAGSAESDRPTKLCAVVKADAYGLGAATIAKHLSRLDVDMLAVYSTPQADDLLAANVDKPVLVLMPLRQRLNSSALRQAAIEGRLHLTIDSPDQLNLAEMIGAELSCPLHVHLHVDTGMSRGGLNAAQFGAQLSRITNLLHVKLAGIYTHFASAGLDVDFLDEQMARFDHLISLHADRIGRDVIIHTANTCASLRGRQFHRDMVRVGIGLYGYGPDITLGAPILSQAHRLQHCVRWCSRIIHVQRYPKGATVGYGSMHRLKRESVLGIVPVGYADGYPLSLSNRGVVCLQNNDDDTGSSEPITAPVLGQVNMDQIIVDLTDVSSVRVGEMVDLISDDPASPCSLPQLAVLAESSCYELLSRLSARLPRIYVHTPAVQTPRTVPTVPIARPLAL